MNNFRRPFKLDFHLPVRIVSPSHWALFGWAAAFKTYSIFDGGLPGVLTEIADTTSLFQDAKGSIPVTAHGDPVKMILNKRAMGGKTAAQFIEAQPELMISSNFDEQIGWAPPPGWEISGGQASHSGSPSYLSQTGNVATGDWYKAAVDMDFADGQNFVSLYLGGSPSIGTVVSSLPFGRIGKALSGNLGFALRGVGEAVVNSFSIKQIPGPHIIAPPGASIGTYKTDGVRSWILMNGTTDGMVIGEIGGDVSDMDVYCALETGADFMLLNDEFGTSGTPHIGISENGNAGAINNPAEARGVEVDGVDVLPKTQATLSTALITGSGKALAVRGMDLSGVDLAFGGDASQRFSGKLYDLAIAPIQTDENAVKMSTAMLGKTAFTIALAVSFVNEQTRFVLESAFS